jgi:hypothetical protein
VTTSEEPLRAVVFLIPLPQPIPIPHLSTFTSTGVEIDALQGIAMQPTEDLPPVPDRFTGRVFVSLRFWQRHVDVTTGRSADHEAVDAIARELVGTEEWDAMPPTAGAEDDAEVAATPTEDREADIEPPEFYETIVEAVTPLVVLPDEVGDAISASYDRVVEAVAGVARAFRNASKTPIAPIARERLPFLILFLTRDLLQPGRNWSQSLLIAHMAAAELDVLSILNEEQLADVQRHLLAVSAGDPLVPYHDRVVDSIHALERLGDTANAVILRQLSIEILLDVLLAMLAWEEGVTPGDAAEQLFALPLTRRLRTAFPPRLGGSWALDRPTETGQWFAGLYALRGRVVHGGYVPSREEARGAMQGASTFEEFIRARVAARASTFPETSLNMLGESGLRQRGAWTSRFATQAANLEEGGLTRFLAWREELTTARASL